MTARLHWAAAALLAISVSTACSSDDPSVDPPVDGDVTYYQDIKPIVDAKCSYCHYEGGLAPFSLLDYASVQTHGGASLFAINEGIMPPWSPDDECRDYHGNRSLDQTQIDLFNHWVELGMPEGDAASEAEPIPSSMPSLSRIDETLVMPEPYEPNPPSGTDDYRCFVLPWPAQYTDTMYMTGFGANPGNDAVVHHVIAFLIPPGSLAEYQALDDAEPGPGYTCYGGPAGSAVPSMLGGWAPGGEGEDLPDGVGLPIEPDSVVVLQVHYNTLAGNGADTTGIDLKLDEQVERPAQIVPFANPAWIAGDSMLIPANEPDVMHEFSFDVTAFTGELEIYTAALHMHTLGSATSLKIERADGSSDCLLDIPDWDFDWQGAYSLVQPETLRSGDQLRIECHWDNGPTNQPMIGGQPKTPEDVTWGEGTTDEMCIGFVLAAAAQ